jgi:glycosyltransferase involved in cell wall biosynthesis
LKESTTVMQQCKHTPLLSICIPTFNRLHYLKESLDILLPQAEKLNVEICVSNNYSTDGTQIYLTEMSKIYSCLRFINQNENISLDRNMGAALAMGNGEYLYPLGDDDVIPRDSLNLIIKNIKKEDDILIQNGCMTDASLTPISSQLPRNIQGREFSTPGEAFDMLWDKMPFGSFIAKRDCFDMSIFSKYIGTYHAYTGVVWHTLSMKFNLTGICRVRCMSDQAVLIRGGVKSWRADSAEIFLYSVPKWFSLLMENNEYVRSCQKLRQKYIKDQTSFESLLQYVSHRQLDDRILGLLINEYNIYDFNKVKQAAMIPSQVANTLIKSKKYTKLITRNLPKKIQRLLRSLCKISDFKNRHQSNQ